MGCLNVTAKRIGDGLHIDTTRVGSGISIQATRIGGMSVTCGLVCTVNSQDKVLWSDRYLVWLNSEVGVVKYNSLLSTQDWQLEEVTIEELL